MFAPTVGAIVQTGVSVPWADRNGVTVCDVAWNAVATPARPVTVFVRGTPKPLDMSKMLWNELVA